VEQQIIAMAMNGRGIRDTARVLHSSPATVLATFKKKNLQFKPSITRYGHKNLLTPGL
jgi:transposase-like protein